MLLGSYEASAEDVRHVACSVLRHRIYTNFVAQAEGIDSMRIISELLNTIKE